MTHPLRAIWTLYARRLRLTLRNRPLIFTRLFQPAIWLTVLGITFDRMFQAARPTPGGIDYLSFMAAGILGMSIIFTALFGGMSLVWDREFGVLKEFLVAPIPRSAIPLGNALAVATEGLFQSLIILVIAIPIGAHFSITPTALAGYAGAAWLIAMTLYGLAAMIAARLRQTQSFMAVMNLLTLPLFFVSGAIYPVQFLPPGLQEFAIASPVTHAVGLIRHFILGPPFSNLDAIWAPLGFSTPELDALLSFTYLVLATVATVGSASWLFRRTTLA